MLIFKNDPFWKRPKSTLERIFGILSIWGSKMVSRWPQDGAQGPKVEPQRPPKGPQRAPKGPKMFSNGTPMPQKRSPRAQNSMKWSPKALGNLKSQECRCCAVSLRSLLLGSCLPPAVCALEVRISNENTYELLSPFARHRRIPS